MVQPIFKCPFCDVPPWHTRMMFWKHIHECLQATQGSQKIQVATVVNIEEPI
ncbi:hypothetical protein [Candidatus Bathycorpusculum sp.]|uniref:hypothetical protein n=1 Tax=Candidatus Bathycorpusculum sp. TaxID=2994959 RepID=UPI002823632C|nr:hypothetical protein [Candidatus Termitimicrobium sp.]